MPKPKICFISLNIYHLLTDNIRHKGIGGAEFQQLLIAKELSRRGYDVSFITLAFDESEITNNVPYKLIPTYKRTNGIRFLRFYYPRLYKIWTALIKSDADIFYVRGASYILAPVVLAAKIKNKKVVFCGANDLDFDPKHVNLPTFRDKLLYLWGLKRCHSLVVQNNEQKELLRNHFNKVGHIIYNGFYKKDYRTETRDEILWVGTIKPLKNPQLFLELAERLPNEKFVMIGGNIPKTSSKNRSFFQKITRKAKKIPNLELTGFLPFNQVEERLSKANLLVNTSPVEGFPNAFLQAWSRGIPVISFVNPDGMITKNSLGIVVKNIDEMVENVTRVVKNNNSLSSKEIKSFFDTYLTIEKIVNQYETIFHKN